MMVTVKLAMFGFPLVVLALFLVMSARRAVIVSIITGWLFLPDHGISLQGLPEYTKHMATCGPVLLAVMIFDPWRLTSLKPHWIDIPMAVFCGFPFLTSIANGLGPYDGISAVVEQMTLWGIPYILGRAYFTSTEGVRELAIAVFVAGLVYVPFCLYEMRMSPQLHHMLYGFRPFSFFDARRLGGYRPAVFLKNGLALGMWMAVTALIGMWLWRTGALRRLFTMPMAMFAPGLLVVSILCRSTGALFLLMGGLFVMFVTKWLRTPVLLACLLAGPPVYIMMRANDIWRPDAVVVTIAEQINPYRARSLEQRLRQEDKLSERAWQRPLLGWGRWGRHRTTTEAGEYDVATDGYWIIIFGQQGLSGLIAFELFMLLPLGLLWRRVGLRGLLSKQAAPAAAMATGLVLYNADCLLNAMPNPIFAVMIGGTLGFAYHVVVARRAVAVPAESTQPAAAKRT